MLDGTASLAPAPRPPSDYEERSHLHDNFTQMTLSLQEEAAAGGECLLELGLSNPRTRGVGLWAWVVVLEGLHCQVARQDRDRGEWGR